MKTGRPKTPTVLNMIRGNPGKRATNADEPKPVLAMPKCPPELGKAAKKEWRRVAPPLFALGLMSDLYRAPLAAYCAAYGRWAEAEKRLQIDGMTATTPNGLVVKSAWLTIADKAFDQMLKSSARFGMDPSSMAGLSVEQKPVDGDDWEKLGRRSS